MDQDRPQVQFYFTTPCPRLKDRKKLKAFIPMLFKKEGKSLKLLEYIFITDNELLEINKKYLKHNFYTDIITFDLSDTDEITGTIYISIDRVAENAISHHTSFTEELHRVIFHGCLHLIGYNDKTAKEQLIMRETENKYLSSYFKQ